MTPPVDARRYRFHLLQLGALPLRPDGRTDLHVEHRCTSVLVWPADEPPRIENALLVDPSYTRAGYRHAQQEAARFGVDPAALRFSFCTHDHDDHCTQFPASVTRPSLATFPEETAPPLAGLQAIPCPGHAPDLRALVFRDDGGREVWAVGDAILDRDWLLDWGYYWPNGYLEDEVLETWRSVARILATADVVIPGHGEPIPVDRRLVEDLCRRYPLAEFGDRCPDVLDTLEARRQRLIGR
ncbi:MAG: hypothetical protein U0736_05775 [Gemmataceae bacterium]